MLRRHIPQAISVLGLIITYFTGFSQPSMPGPVVVCPRLESDMHTHIGMPSNLPLDSFTGNLLAVSTFQVTYVDFPPQAEVAFQHAVNIWQALLESQVPIRIQATWQNLGEQTLANAGATVLYRNFPNAPRTEVWYPVALAESLSGQELNNADPDIRVSVNSTVNWYFGTDGNPPAGQYDLVTIILHELAHGLGFFASTDVEGGQGQWGSGGFPFIYDLFIENNAGQRLTDTDIFPNPSTQLRNQLTGRNLFFSGEATRQDAPPLPRLYAPLVFTRGSSISHLDEATYPAGTPNSLMTPRIGRAESNQSPGDILLNIFADLGWQVIEPDAPPIAVRVFPNPVSDRLLIDARFRQTVADVSVTLYNALGQRIQEGFSGRATRLLTGELDVSTLPAGVYLVHVNAGDESSVQKVVVRR